jgi:phospholipid/cholesterol/gamma-HCH transport system substrate-binding protein
LYVDLVPPAQITGHIQPGAVLAADTSTPTVELDQALNAGYRLLTAVQPSKLDATLTAIATALNGRGQKLGALVSQISHYTAQVAPHTGQFIHDIAVIGTVGRQLSTNAPDLFRILDDAVALSQTIAADQPTLTRVLNAGPVVANQTNRLLAANRARLNSLLHLLHPVIGILSRHTFNLINTLGRLQLFLKGAARALGQGPYLRLLVTPDSKLSRGRAYTAANCPRYRHEAGPNCPTGHNVKGTSPAAVIQALVDHAAGADSTNPHNPSAVNALKQRLAIAGILLGPVLRAVGGLGR